jgi:hypothetical protein
MTLAIPVDRFDYVAGSWLFWSENHSGQGSEGYARLSRYQFNPGACFTGWQSLSETARDVYRAWCERESVDCEYDTIKYVLGQHGWDVENPNGCLEYFLESYGDDNINESGLCNYDRSDFVNCDMPYTRDLINFYNDNSSDILDLVDEYCEAIGVTSRLEALEGQTIEDPDDLAAALVNCGMTYLAGQLASAVGLI